MCLGMKSSSSWLEMTYWTVLIHAPLLLCSIVALAIVLERLTFYSRLTGLGKKEQQAIEDQFSGVATGATTPDRRGRRAAFDEAVSALRRYRNAPKPLRDEAVSIALQHHASRLRKNLTGISTVGTLAPIFGLLGTVAGLMVAFRNIGKQQGPVEPAVIADGLWVALSTTAIGLVIAAFCILAYAAFSSFVRQRLSEAENLFNRISLSLEAHTLEEQRP